VLLAADFVDRYVLLAALNRAFTCTLLYEKKGVNLYLTFNSLTELKEPD
jgi:hypothetical protein